MKHVGGIEIVLFVVLCVHMLVVNRKQTAGVMEYVTLSHSSAQNWQWHCFNLGIG